MITIKRVADSEYHLIDADDVIEVYDQTEMKHPDDWIADAPSVSGPYDWEYIDDR